MPLPVVLVTINTLGSHCLLFLGQDKIASVSTSDSDSGDIIHEVAEGLAASQGVKLNHALVEPGADWQWDEVEAALLEQLPVDPSMTELPPSEPQRTHGISFLVDLDGADAVDIDGNFFRYFHIASPDDETNDDLVVLEATDEGNGLGYYIDHAEVRTAVFDPGRQSWVVENHSSGEGAYIIQFIRFAR